MEGGRGSEGDLCSLSAAALRGFRAGIVNVVEEIQCCRPPLVRQRDRVLIAFVETGGVRK